ncbi:hypothetical protein FF1_038423 [Malus domestica]
MSLMWLELWFRELRWTSSLSRRVRLLMRRSDLGDYSHLISRNSLIHDNPTATSTMNGILWDVLEMEVPASDLLLSQWFVP